jgi:hypothetical protein
MREDILVPLMLFGSITAWVVFPIYFRHKLYSKQLDTVAAALEKGIDPEKIKLGLPREEEDVNGNWKAGIILIGLGLAFDLMMAAAYFQFDEFRLDDGPGVMVFMPGVMSIILGLVLLFIHRTIVGPVQSRADRLATRGNDSYSGSLNG